MQAETTIAPHPQLPAIDWKELAAFAQAEHGGARALVSEVEFEESYCEAWLDRNTLVRSGEAGIWHYGKLFKLPYAAIYRFQEPPDGVTSPTPEPGPTTLTLKNDLHNTEAKVTSDHAGKIGWSQLATAKRKLCGRQSCPCYELSTLAAETGACGPQEARFEMGLELTGGLFRPYLTVGGAA